MDTKVFLKNIIKYCIPSVISAIIGLVAIPVISGIYPTDDYGKINLFYSVGNTILYILLLGLDSAYIRFYFEPPKGTNRAVLFSMAFIIGAVNDLVVCLLAFFAFPSMVSNYLFGESNYGLIIMMGVYIFGLMLFRLLSIETRMENKALLFNVQQILLIFTNRVSFVFVAFWSTEYKYSIIAISLSSFVLGVLFLILQKGIKCIDLNRIPKESFKSVLAFAIPLMPTTVMTWLNNSAAKMVLSAYGAFKMVGILSIATSLANVFSLVPAAFNTYWSPFMYANYRTQQSFIKKVHNYILVLSIVISLIIYCFQDVLYIFVKGEYSISQMYFMLIMLAPIQSLICETTCYGINISNNTILNLYISLVAGAFNIGASAVLFRPLGIWGVIIGISGSALIQLVAKTVVGQKFYDSIENPMKTYTSFAIILLICLSNTFTYNALVARGGITVFVLIITYLIFRMDINLLVKKVMRAIVEKKNGSAGYR